MKVNGAQLRSLWRQGDALAIIDQSRLPFEFQVVEITSVAAAAHAIRTMQVRGAPLIGATAACGIALAMQEGTSDAHLRDAAKLLGATRPTAVNLRWALLRMVALLTAIAPAARVTAAWQEAQRICDEDVQMNQAIGRNGVDVLRAIAAKKGHDRVQILTHCNAGWLATVDRGTALAPVYLAHDEGMALHVWVDETRPRNQGLLTAWELAQHGVPHTVIADNAGGHLMQRGKVDAVIVGADRVTANGDVANKIGTYLKALAAFDSKIPFYVAAPGPTIDWAMQRGEDIPIEERSSDELAFVAGLDEQQNVRRVRVLAPASDAANPAFDVTPARLITGLITERGIAPATREGLRALYPEQRA